MHGSGTFKWANGNKYDGNFEKGQRMDKGKYVWANGDWYEGNFTANL
jgi:hypothetical protein